MNKACSFYEENRFNAGRICSRRAGRRDNACLFDEENRFDAGLVCSKNVKRRDLLRTRITMKLNTHLTGQSGAY